jgi:hypothetical protein
MPEMLKMIKATKVTRVRALVFQLAAVGIAKISGKMTTTTVMIEISTIDCMMTTGNLLIRDRRFTRDREGAPMDRVLCQMMSITEEKSLQAWFLQVDRNKISKDRGPITEKISQGTD